ncbi:MAG: GntR family transcriptional regulator [Saprospiraceae bacterium]|nr:GntR family transcriptional regulator [Saprospiraceae bacterium]|tara:strand:+ start:4011 stop:4379 length:369 start_codon:yes stop_codon:yes gene_type:complete
MKFNDNRPIFKQIADYILDNVVSGIWQEGERLISVRELASEIEVNPNTVARTYAMLSNMGIIYNQRGIGYFITANAQEKCLSQLKQEFIENELPELFRKMNLLDLDLEQIKKYYDDQKNEEK